MVCYETFTRKLPLEDHFTNGYDIILNGQHPKLPKCIDDWKCDLLQRCWHSNPIARSSFDDIIDIVVLNSPGLFKLEVK